MAHGVRVTVRATGGVILMIGDDDEVTTACFGVMSVLRLVHGSTYEFEVMRNRMPCAVVGF